MTHSKLLSLRSRWFAVSSMLLLALAGCSGDDGSDGAPGEEGPVRTSTAKALNISIDSVTINSAPVVALTVKDENGIPLAGLTTDNLRFDIAKLVPGTNGDPSAWQNYINNSDSQGTTENTGTLEDMGNGHFQYTFATDITDPAATGGISYEPSLTHRVAIQVSGFPAANPTYDFRPSDGATTGLFSREIVKIGNCNECHNKLAMHGGGRIDTKFCVTCHNPGSTDPDTGNTVDFKVLIHKIHRGENLPSVVAGGSYEIIGYKGSVHDFSDVVFPQDIRNCTKCHDGSDPETPEGGNWKTKLSMAACGACHDDIDFSRNGVVGAANYDPAGHPGGVMADNSECITCHAANKVAGSVAEKHTDPVKAMSARFKYTIVSVTGGVTPVIEFKVTDPTNGDAPYNITTDPAFAQVPTRVSRIALIVGWNTTDFTNNNSGVNPALPTSIFPTPQCGGPTHSSMPVSADWVCTGPVAGVYTLTKQSALPAEATGTGRVGFEGHVAGLDTADPPDYTVEVPVKSVVKDWSIDGSTLKARRTVVDIAKCDQCHDQLSMHGSNRTDEPQLCVMCHNPNNTDANVRPKTSGILSGGVDGKLEESIDFKRMIHGIHAAAKSKHGFREEGIVVYGYGNSVHDFSDVRFPGILQDCETCHVSGSYVLDSNWELPTQSGILGSTISTTPTATDATTYDAQLAIPDDDLNISPTAAVCSSCHDGLVARTHMITAGGAVFDETQSVINSSVIETCSVCHGPGSIADVEVVHTSSVAVH